MGAAAGGALAETQFPRHGPGLHSARFPCKGLTTQKAGQRVTEQTGRAMCARTSTPRRSPAPHRSRLGAGEGRFHGAAGVSKAAPKPLGVRTTKDLVWCRSEGHVKAGGEHGAASQAGQTPTKPARGTGMAGALVGYVRPWGRAPPLLAHAPQERPPTHT